MKIYTKQGDQGETSLLGGERVSKDDSRIEAYGSIDELNCFVGWLRDQLASDEHEHQEILVKIQEKLLVISSLLAATAKHLFPHLPVISDDDVKQLEKFIDEMSKQLPKLHAFIIPGGHQVVSSCHIVRSVCRRAERQVVKLSREQSIEPLIIIYLNRLSDFFFTLARYLGKRRDVAEWHWQATD